MTQMHDVTIGATRTSEKLDVLERRHEALKATVENTPNISGANDAWANPANQPSHSWTAGRGTSQGPTAVSAGSGGGGPPAGPPGGSPTHNIVNGPLGPIGNVAQGKVFDDKVALDQRYQYNGSKEQGAQWREKTRGYLISKSPALFKLLPWAE